MVGVSLCDRSPPASDFERWIVDFRESLGVSQISIEGSCGHHTRSKSSRNQEWRPMFRRPGLPLPGEKLPDRRALLLVLDTGEEALSELHDRFGAIEGQLGVH